MSVNPGWGGQSFIPATLDRLPRCASWPTAARAGRSRSTAASAPTTIADVHRAGANILVAGLGHLRAADPGDAYRELVALVAGASAGVALTGADAAYLERCLELAERGAPHRGAQSVVGCVLVRDGAVLGEGWHERPGLPHAEAVALAAAGDAARRDRLRQPRAVRPPRPHAALRRRADRRRRRARRGRRRSTPTPTRRRGIARLRAGRGRGRAGRRRHRAAGPPPERGLPHAGRAAAARTSPTRRRSALDGRTAAAGGEPRWISSPESRALVHEWRARSGAVRSAAAPRSPTTRC